MTEGEKAERRWHTGGQTEKWSLSEQPENSICTNKVVSKQH